MLNILFEGGTLNFRASNNNEALPSEIFVIMVVWANSLHEISPKPPKLKRSLRDLNKSEAYSQVPKRHYWPIKVRKYLLQSRKTWI